MPKPRETHHRERKGHSHPAHRYTLTQQWWMAITSLSVLEFPSSCPNAVETKGKAKTWLVRWKLQESPRKKKKALISQTLACQRWWTDRSILVLDPVCASLCRPASVELTNLSFRRKHWEKCHPLRTMRACFQRSFVAFICAVQSKKSFFAWLRFNCFLNVPPQLHYTAGQMGCQCCRMIKRWVWLCSRYLFLFVCFVPRFCVHHQGTSFFRVVSPKIKHLFPLSCSDVYSVLL